MTINFSKRVRRLLEELASVAYERELGTSLGPLFQSFERWQRKEIDAIALDDEVHRYSTGGPKRQLYLRYHNKTILPMIVAAAIVRGILRPAEVSDEIRIVLEDKIEYYKIGLADGSISFKEEED